MSQNEPKINPATGYVHDDSQLEDAQEIVVVEEPVEATQEDNKEATE